MKNLRYFCLICKKLADKDSKKGIIGGHLLGSMFWYDSEEEVIEHIKETHPKIYKKTIEENKSKMDGEQMKIQSECPYCKSKDLSDGKSDFIISNGEEKLIQFCSNCHKEWFIDGGENK